MLAIVILLVVGGIFSIKKSIQEEQMKQYNEAVALFDAGDYEQAKNKFTKIKSFSDSELYIEQADYLLEERKIIYNNAILYFEAAQYSKALEEFNKISVSYEKKDIYIEQCADQLYIEAEEYYKKENYEKAKNILCNFPDNTEVTIKAESLLSTIETELYEQRMSDEYDTAVRLYGEGDYMSAQRGFITLGDYKSSSTSAYLNEIGNIFYNQALEAYNTGDYRGCADIISNIDSVEEWSGYEMALDLLKNAKESFRDPVKNEAKRICRENGYSEMCAYIDSQVCILLTSEEASQLKIDCEVKRTEMRNLSPYMEGEFGLRHMETAEDTLGNIYGWCLEGHMDVEDGGAYEVYYLAENNYKVLTATVAVMKPWSSIDEQRVGIIRIYGDDRLLWADTSIKSRTKPYMIEVSVDGVKELKIEMYGDGNMGNTGIHVLLCEPMLIE